MGLVYRYEGRRSFVSFIFDGEAEVGSATCDVGHVPPIDVPEDLAAIGPEAVVVDPREDGAERVGSGDVERDVGPGGDAAAGAVVKVDGRKGQAHLLVSAPGNRKDKYGNPTSWGVLRAQKYALRKLALELSLKDDATVRRDIRRRLEVISLLYASKAKDGDEFRQASGMAIDLGGYKVENQAKAKIRAQKAEAKAQRKGLKQARQAELGEAPKEVKF